jgi:hypothetical protein
MVDLNGTRIKHPSQIVDLIRFTASTQHTALHNTLKATLAVLGLHLTRYLHGVGHPDGCEHMVSSLSIAKQQQLSAFDPGLLRANLFLRVVSEYEFLPLDPKFDLTVRIRPSIPVTLYILLLAGDCAGPRRSLRTWSWR